MTHFYKNYMKHLPLIKIPLHSFHRYKRITMTLTIDNQQYTKLNVSMETFLTNRTLKLINNILNNKTVYIVSKNDTTANPIQCNLFTIGLQTACISRIAHNITSTPTTVTTPDGVLEQIQLDDYDIYYSL